LNLLFALNRTILLELGALPGRGKRRHDPVGAHSRSRKRAVPNAARGDPFRRRFSQMTMYNPSHEQNAAL